MIHAGIVWFDHDDVSIVVPAHALGFAEVGLGHLHRSQELAVRRELLHTPGHIDHVEIVRCIDGEGSGFVELTNPGATRADDPNGAEQRALNVEIPGL